MSQGQSEGPFLTKKQLIWKRASFLSLIRSFFLAKGYWEIDTPVILPYPIPEAHIDPITAEGGYLHPSPEMAMKVLLGHGAGKIYQITRCFRGGEKGRFHMPEFLMLEWYQRGVDYSYMMHETQELILYLSEGLLSGHTISGERGVIDLEGPWPRIPIRDAFLALAGIPLERAIREERFEELMVLSVEPNLPRETPCFLVEFPAELASLSRLRPDGATAERFELYVAGIELANGFSELSDPEEQVRRFRVENEKRVMRGKEAYPVSRAFLSAIGSMGEAAGVAMGLDRLLMLFLNQGDVESVQPVTYKDLIN